MTPTESFSTQKSRVAYAVDVIGQVVDRAYSHALQVDHLGHLIVEALGDLDSEARIALGSTHPELLRRLLELEHYYLKASE